MYWNKTKIYRRLADIISVRTEKIGLYDTGRGHFLNSNGKHVGVEIVRPG